MEIFVFSLIFVVISLIIVRSMTEKPKQESSAPPEKPKPNPFDEKRINPHYQSVKEDFDSHLLKKIPKVETTETNNTAQKNILTDEEKLVADKFQEVVYKEEGKDISETKTEKKTKKRRRRRKTDEFEKMMLYSDLLKKKYNQK